MTRVEPERRPRGWRRLSFAGESFLWRVLHEHHVIAGRRCREVLVVKPTTRRGPTLRLEFGEDGHGQAGYPQAGVVWVFVPPSGAGPSANLNLPRMARAAIEVARERGWDPAGAQHVTAIDGWPLLDALIERFERLGGA